MSSELKAFVKSNALFVLDCISAKVDCHVLEVVISKQVQELRGVILADRNSSLFHCSFDLPIKKVVFFPLLKLVGQVLLKLNMGRNQKIRRIIS